MSGGIVNAKFKSQAHLYLFVIGWGYYILIPMILGRFGLFELLGSFDVMSKYVASNDSIWPSFIAYAFAMPLFFGVGSWWAQKLPKSRKVFPVNRMSLKILLPFYGFTLAYVTLEAQGRLFTGYIDGVDVSLAGPMAALEMALVLQYLMAKISGSNTTKLYGWLLTITSILLLSMGGRLYAVSCLVSIYVYWWIWSAGSDKVRRLSLLSLLIGPLMLALVGMLRAGGLNFPLLIFFLLAEASFTSISAFTILSGPIQTLSNGPAEFITAFLNIVPAAIWPDKQLSVVSLLNSELSVESPFGAMSIVASTIGNFGFFGGLIFFTFVGYILGRSSSYINSAYSRALYCYLCGLIPFMFFRDPFQVQVKVVITGFIVIMVNVLIDNFTRLSATSDSAHKK